MVINYATRNSGSMERIGLKTARKRANLTQEAVAERMGVSVPQISRWENGKDGIPSQRLNSLRKAYEASLEELLAPTEANVSDDHRSVLVEQLPTMVGLGGGGTGEGEYRAIAFGRSLIEGELKASADDLLAIEVEGDSMKPEFLSGDRLLIDKRRRSLAQPGAFCLWDGDGYVVKYLERLHDTDPPKVRVHSENPRYSPADRLAEELQVLGRVVWLSRKL